MLQNVFHKTKLIQGEKTLSLKYAPVTVAECCISEYDRFQVKYFLENERFFAVRSDSGCGATVCIKCIANEMGLFFVHELSCSQGYTEILKLIKGNMRNVLLALQQHSKKILFFIKDIEILKRNERAQIVSAIEESNMYAVMFFNNVLFHTKWKIFQFSPMTVYDKMLHLCWICAEEEIDLELEQIHQLAEFTDLRNAINSLKLKESMNIQERDHDKIDNFSKLLFSYESIDCQNTEVLSTFSDLICLYDIAEYKPTRYWYIDTISDYIDQNNFKYTHKHSHIARNAQMIHRTNCLQKSCNILSINITDMKLCAFLYKHLLMKNINPLNTLSPNYKYEAKSLYTIAKLGANSPQCKYLKNFLGIR